jgi:L-ribulose-5-phosphate 3-epimerase
MATQPMEPSFITANLVAKEVGYKLQPFNWGVADKATRDAFHGPNFGEKFNELCATVAGLGFKAIDIWVAHLDPTRASDAMVNEAKDILKKNGLHVVAYTAGLGKPSMTVQEGEQVYKVAKAIGTPVIDVGLHPSNAKLAFDLGKEYGIKYAIENHPNEKVPQDVLDQIGPYGEWIGVAQDTGFWGMFGYDAVKATHELKDHLFHMHLKQMKQLDGHWECCAFKDGVVNVNGVVQALHELGYKGAISIEIETNDHSPIDDVVSSYNDLKSWLQYLGVRSS